MLWLSSLLALLLHAAQTLGGWIAAALSFVAVGVWVTPPTYTSGEVMTPTLMNNISGDLLLLKTCVDANGGVEATELVVTVTGLQSNYAPGLVGNSVLIWTGVANGFLDGLSGGIAGQRLTISNQSSTAGALLGLINSPQSVSSSANQFTNISAGLPCTTLSLATGVTYLAVGGWAEYMYDSTVSRWRMMSSDQGAWISTAIAFASAWTASGTAPAIGNGSIASTFKLSGLTMDFEIGLTFGSTSTFGTGVWSLSLPTANNGTGMLAVALLTFPGTGVWAAVAFAAGAATTFSIYESHAGASPGIGPTSPATWASTDQILVSGRYATS